MEVFLGSVEYHLLEEFLPLQHVMIYTCTYSNVRLLRPERTTLSSHFTGAEHVGLDNHPGDAVKPASSGAMLDMIQNSRENYGHFATVVPAQPTVYAYPVRIKYLIMCSRD